MNYNFRIIIILVRFIFARFITSEMLKSLFSKKTIRLLEDERELLEKDLDVIRRMLDYLDKSKNKVKEDHEKEGSHQPVGDGHRFPAGNHQTGKECLGDSYV